MVQNLVKMEDGGSLKGRFGTKSRPGPHLIDFDSMLSSILEANSFKKSIFVLYQSEGGNGCNECPGRDRDMD